MMENVTVNHLAVLAAALSDFVVGALWYSPLLFVKVWMKETGITEEKMKKDNPVVKYGLTFVFSLVITYNLAFFLGNPESTLGDYLLYSALAGFGWASMAVGILSLFEMRGWKLMLINWGYVTIAFVLKGLILGLWR
jgi:membrane-associated HD superfamily phosphohydrolase